MFLLRTGFNHLKCIFFHLLSHLCIGVWGGVEEGDKAKRVTIAQLRVDNKSTRKTEQTEHTVDYTYLTYIYEQ